MKEYEAKLSKILPDIEGPKDFNKVADTKNVGTREAQYVVATRG